MNDKMVYALIKSIGWLYGTSFGIKESYDTQLLLLTIFSLTVCLRIRHNEIQDFLMVQIQNIKVQFFGAI